MKSSRLNTENDLKIRRGDVGQIWGYARRGELKRPFFLSLVQAGFPSPAEDYIRSKIDLNTELIKHPAATFYVRVIGDSMEPDICAGEILIVDRAAQVKSGDIVVARLGTDMCVKEFKKAEDGSITLVSANPNYQPFIVTAASDFEVWGKVLWSIKGH